MSGRRAEIGRQSREQDANAIATLLRAKTMQPVFNVQDLAYGAVGDGTTDDAASFQAAIDAADAAGGGVVYVPAKATYIIGAGLVLGSDTSLIGGGWSTILKEKDSSNLTYMIDAPDESNVYVSDLQLDGNKANQTNNLLAGIRFDGTTDVVVERVLAHSFKGTTGAGNEGAGIVIRGDSAYEARTMISNCITHSIGGYGIGTYRAGAVLITNCLSYDNDSMGISLSGSTTAKRNNTISNCAAWDNGQVGFNLENQANTVVSGCISDGHNVTGLGGYRIQAGARIVIADCISNNDELGVAFSSSVTDEPTEVILDGLVIIGADSHGIQALSSGTPSNRIQISNCLINSAGGDGVRVEATNQNVTIANNMIFASGIHGIRALHTGRVVISDNTCQSNTNNGIRLSSSSGTATVTGNNSYNNGTHGISIENIAEERGATVTGNNCNNNSQTTGDTTDGILILDSLGCAVTGNVCSDDQGTATQRTGIRESGTCNYNTYVGNVMRGNATSALVESGANNKAAHNVGSGTHDT
jgi:parallel beta-helix repeat protein